MSSILSPVAKKKWFVLLNFHELFSKCEQKLDVEIEL